jgi:uncharacterized protein
MTAAAPTPTAAAPAAPHRSPLARLLVGALHGYQRWISPMRAPACRFTPSCSAYAVEAIGRHGAAYGAWLALRRLSRCHPYHRGGHDPVPQAVGRRRGDLTGRPGVRRSGWLGRGRASAAISPSSSGAPRC